jgi:hypothetical protein
VAVEVLRDTGSGGTTQIHADVHPVGVIRVLQSRRDPPQQGKEVRGLLVSQLLEAGEVPLGQNEQVTRTVGVGVQDRETQGREGYDPLDDETPSSSRVTEDALARSPSLVIGGGRHVGLAPRGAQTFESHY